MVEQKLFRVHEGPEYILENQFGFGRGLVVNRWRGKFGFEFGDFLSGWFPSKAADEEFHDNVVGAFAIFEEFFHHLSSCDFSFDGVAIEKVEGL